MIYAYTAFERGYPFVNFTPSPCLAPAAIQELALKQHLPFYGNDGKTGETLVKTVLARCSARGPRGALVGGLQHPGGGDGRVLADPRHKRSKLRSKGVSWPARSHAPHAGVRIEYVPSLGN